MIFDSYKVNPQHRGRLPQGQKSRWTVDQWEELRLFSLAKEHEWKCREDHILWALSSRATALQAVGTDGKEDLFIAKYVADHQHQWHGYPVSPRQFDIPPSEVIKAWVKDGLVSKAVGDRILRGKL